mmetsp:Transcript_35178/g.105053  ORF Transcript_35178/g.105053 Transcript_35178/m.105053 type:complete len:295 (-) Transcript_35178:1167-2051(-)
MSEKSLFLNLPEVILYSVLTFVAPPTDRAAALCHRVAPLNSAHHRAVESRWDILWSAIRDNEYGCLHGQNSSSGGSSGTAPRRASKRLRRTPKDQVRDAHTLLLDNTKIAHFALSEMAHSSRTSLTLARLRWMFREYGPVLRVNQRADIGGTFLIKCCRARYVEERAVLRCVRELVERHGALPDVASAVTVPGRSGGKGDYGLTPLCVAAARGMPSLAKYLLKIGASPVVEATGRFRLFSNPGRSIFGTYTPLGFARAMKAKELENGASDSDLRSLNECIKALHKAERRPLDTT